MAKLTVLRNDNVIREVALVRQRMIIGRKAESDILLDDLAVSGEHARVTTILDDSFLEDLDSTTGTSVNGAQVKKHILCDGDVVEIGAYRLLYRARETAPAETPVDGAQDAAPDALHAAGAATVRLLTGPQAGTQVDLSKTTTKLGKPGVQVAAITRDAAVYLLQHIEGSFGPMVNGAAIPAEGLVLHDGDVIELAGQKLKFSRRPD